MNNFFKRNPWLLIALALVGCQNSVLARPKAAPAVAKNDDPGCNSCLSQASGLFARGNNLEAANVLRGWLGKCPNNLQLHLLLNTILTRLPDAKAEALSVAREAIAIAPDSMLAHLQAAMTMMTMGNQSGAAAEFEEVVALDPGNYDAWLSLSEMYGTLKQPDKAKAAELKASSLSPSARNARTRTITSLNSASKIAAVRSQLKEYLASPDIPVEGMLAIGDDALNLGYFEEAAQCFGRVCEQYPASSTARFKQSLSLYLAGDIDSALAAVASSTSKNKIDNQSRALQALCWLSSGDLEKGRTAVSELTGDLPLASFAAGYLAYKDGDNKKALPLLNTACKDKALFPAQILVAKINLKDGDAIEAASRANELRKVSGVQAQALALELCARLKQEDLNKQNLVTLKAEVLKMYNSLPDVATQKYNRSALCLALAQACLTEGNKGEAKMYLSKAAGGDQDDIAACAAALAGSAKQ